MTIRRKRFDHGGARSHDACVAHGACARAASVWHSGNGSRQGRLARAGSRARRAAGRAPAGGPTASPASTSPAQDRRRRRARGCGRSGCGVGARDTCDRAPRAASPAAAGPTGGPQKLKSPAMHRGPIGGRELRPQRAEVTHRAERTRASTTCARPTTSTSRPPTSTVHAERVARARRIAEHAADRELAPRRASGGGCTTASSHMPSPGRTSPGRHAFSSSVGELRSSRPVAVVDERVEDAARRRRRATPRARRRCRRRTPRTIAATSKRRAAVRPRTPDAPVRVERDANRQ